MISEEHPQQPSVSIGPWKRLQRTRIYQNPWIHLWHDTVLRPNGSEGIYGVVDFQNRALGVIALNNKGEIALIGQHRYPLDTYTWEIPEGGGPMDEDPLTAIQRELREETGYLARKWIPLLAEIQLSNSVTNEKAWIWLAQDLEYVGVDPDETEELQIQWIPLEEALIWVDTGKIVDSISIMALLAVQRKHSQGLIAL